MSDCPSQFISHCLGLSCGCGVCECDYYSGPHCSVSPCPLTGGAIAGITVGAVVFVTIILCVLALFWRHRYDAVMNNTNRGVIWIEAGWRRPAVMPQQPGAIPMSSPVVLQCGSTPCVQSWQYSQQCPQPYPQNPQ